MEWPKDMRKKFYTTWRGPQADAICKENYCTRVWCTNIWVLVKYNGTGSSAGLLLVLPICFKWHVLLFGSLVALLSLHQDLTNCNASFWAYVQHFFSFASQKYKFRGPLRKLPSTSTSHNRSQIFQQLSLTSLDRLCTGNGWQKLSWLNLLNTFRAWMTYMLHNYIQAGDYAHDQFERLIGSVVGNGENFNSRRPTHNMWAKLCRL